jgi:uncharacterized protein
MKQQVVAIHGGTSFDTHDDYIAFLKTREVTLERLQHLDDWKGWLGRELGADFEVLTPKMPNATNARYAEWSIWLERCLPFLRDDVILLGHSLGGIFLAKYLAEHQFPKRIKATLLVAAPFDATSTVESLTDFALPASLQGLAAQSGKLYLFQSKDDPVVPFSEMAKYQQVLPAAEAVIFETKGHFNEQTFPELATLLRSL